MESFKLVLPSNASHNHFPDNTSSRYKTYLHDPIQLEGRWEVAAESIYYSANIKNEHEKASITFSLFSEELSFINSMYPWQFKVAEDNTWLGFKGIEIPMSNETYKIIEDLNDANEIIITKSSVPLFHFKLDQHHRVIYTCRSPNFTLNIHPYIAEELGFGKHNYTFVGTGPYTGRAIANKHIGLDNHKDEHHFKTIRFFHNQLTEHERRITLKYPGELLNLNWLLKMWNDRIKPHYNLVLEYSKNLNLTIHDYANDKAVVFSPELGKTIGHVKPLISNQTRWSDHGYLPSRKWKDEHWYIDVYNSQLQMASVMKNKTPSFSFYPYLFSSAKDMISFLNGSISSFLKTKLDKYYDTGRHSFSLTMSSSHQRVTLNLGSWIYLNWTPNISKLLGFDKRNFIHGSHVSSIAPSTPKEMSQRVLLMTDITESIFYGNQRLCVLQDFVHRVKGPNIIEKRFQPLSFVPVIRNYIDTISIQLVNEEQQQITAKDVKTVVVLHFQRVK